MEYLARKIDPGKWWTKPYLQPHDIRADAITGPSLQTKDDKLSVWQCNKEQVDISEVVLALMANERTSAIEGIYILLFEMNELITEEFKIINSPKNAQTLVADLIYRHLDVVELHAGKIMILAQKVARRVRQNIDLHFFTKLQVCDILGRAVGARRFELDSLKRLKPEDKAAIQLRSTALC